MKLTKQNPIYKIHTGIITFKIDIHYTKVTRSSQSNYPKTTYIPIPIQSTYIYTYTYSNYLYIYDPYYNPNYH